MPACGEAPPWLPLPAQLALKMGWTLKIRIDTLLVGSRTRRARPHPSKFRPI
jgi:hypothetical protein